MSPLSAAADPRRRAIVGVCIALGCLAGLGGVMFALRAFLSDGAIALVLVVPVVVGVTVGGTWAGVAAAGAGFLLYDLVFIRPYYSIRVASPRNWLTLAVYLAVVGLVARILVKLRVAEEEARIREADSQRMLELSELLLQDRPAADLLPLVVSKVRDAFGCESVVLLLPRKGALEVVAKSGRDLTGAELRRVRPAPGVTSSLMPPATPSPGDDPETTLTETIVLSAPGHPVGLIGLVGTRPGPRREAVARGFANHIALALDRAQLQEQALRTSVLEEVDRLRGALVGAVSHDLRTPLATIKAAATALLDDGSRIARPDGTELLGLIDEQADRLARLVTNLLDMSRIETGSLVVDRQPLDLGAVVAETVAAMRPNVGEDRIVVRLPPALPSIDADPVLIGQVIVNLLENALRYAPLGTAVEVAAGPVPGAVEVTVTDRGPGFPEHDRIAVFGLARPTSSAAGHDEDPCRSAAPAPGHAASPAGGSGVGLAIAKAFVEAHGGKISAGNLPGGGARVVFSLPIEAPGR